MTNRDKFKYGKERLDAFTEFCDRYNCTDCPIFINSNYKPCVKVWLDMEVSEEEGEKKHDKQR